MEDKYFLQLKNIKKSFGGVRALKGVNFDIKQGEIHSLVGENGSGKSTMIKIISGFYIADSGKMIINGKEYTKISPHYSTLEGIQVIYQDFSNFPNLNVMENIAIANELANNYKLVNNKRYRKIALEAMQRIDFKVDLTETVGNLSVADRQLVAICRALVKNAKLIVMDEPTSALSKKDVKSLFKVIKELQKQDISVLFVSHKIDEVFEISERVTIIRNGENVITENLSKFDTDKFSYYMTGREFKKQETLSKINNDNGKALEVRDLNLRNGYYDISFDLNRGEILGVTGLLGSGRNILMESIFGYRKPDTGEIYIEGKKVKINSVYDALSLGIGYLADDRLTKSLFHSQSIRINIAVASLDILINFGLLDEAAINKMVNQLVKKFNIVTSDIYNPVETLSGGNQQKVVLSRLLALNLKVLILNGPTIGVDIGAKYDIYQIIRDLAKSGLPIIIISDDIPEIINNTNRILIMREGQIYSEVQTSDISSTKLESLIMD